MWKSALKRTVYKRRIISGIKMPLYRKILNSWSDLAVVYIGLEFIFILDFQIPLLSFAPPTPL